ncbi:hypothetical protein [Pseudomonas fluorescens]|uniref:Uncharacterized protein n=1 Tax=Pseudomonas fluorescens TaxID=294 RepID=A0A5E7Q560_PSEFL|nr:hypothetical protein [Pseudomonas fluorescens]VVP56738.1 hypothetical protein PS880_05750 [Pseudomonas fluorescens]
MNKHDIAVGMIDSRFALLLEGDTSEQLHGETSMAIEMAHASGAIDDDERRHYLVRHYRILARQYREILLLLEQRQ